MSNIVNNIKKIVDNNKASGVSPIDIFKPETEWLDSEMSDSRIAICKACPELIKLTKQCRKCGCFMAIKTKIEKASCPMGKW
jgi:hypothetical protein